MSDDKTATITAQNPHDGPAVMSGGIPGEKTPDGFAPSGPAKVEVTPDPIALVKHDPFTQTIFEAASELIDAQGESDRFSSAWQGLRTAVDAYKDAEIIAYACGSCGIVRGSVMRDGDGAIDRARECCEPSKCDTCGQQSRKHWTRCDACSARERQAVLQRAFDKAKKITPAEWGDPVVDPTGRAGNDGWCSDLETLRDHYELQDEEEFPKWAWATEKHGGSRPQAEDIIENITQEMHEDAAEDFDAADLQKRLDEWFDAQTAHTYSEDDSIAIVLDDAFWGTEGDPPSGEPQPEDEQGLAAPLPVLSIYRNEVIEWIIASSVEDAWKIWEEQSAVHGDGETRSDYAEMEWEIVEKPFKMWVGPKGLPCEVGDGDLVEHTPDEWIAICGRGYLGSTEY